VKPRLIPLALALALTLVPTACNRAGPRTATPEPTAVRFVYEQAFMSAYYEELAASFEAANPGIDVQLEQANPYSALQSTASPADVADVDQLSLALLAEAGVIRDLEPLLQESPDVDLDAFYQGAIDAMRWHGDLWGLPADVDPWVLYYNRDMFDAAGLDYPTANWTWDDMLTAAMELTDPTEASPVYGLLLALNRADFVPMVYQNGGTLVDNLVSPTMVTFTDPATIEAVEWYVGLSMNLGVAPTPRELSALGGFERAVIGQRGAMWYGPLSDRGGQTWGTEWPFNWGVVSPPGNRAYMTLITMRAYVMGAAPGDTAAAWAWLCYLAEHPSLTRDVPPLVAVAESDAFRSAQREDVAIAASDAMAIGHTIPPETWIGEIANWLGDAMTAIYDGEMDVQAAPVPVRAAGPRWASCRAGSVPGARPRWSRRRPTLWPWRRYYPHR